MTEKRIVLRDGPPWGFRVSGGSDTNLPVRITRVNPGSAACQAGVREADIVKEINSQPLANVTNVQVQHLLSAGPTLTLTLVTPNQQKRRDTISSAKRKTPQASSAAHSGRTASESSIHQGEDARESPPTWTAPGASSPLVNRKFKPINFSQSSHSDGEEKLRQESVTLPRYPSPTVTLLQKARQGEFPKGAHYLQTTPPVKHRNPVPERSYSSLDREKDYLQYCSEPESRRKANPKTTFIPRRSETPRGIRFDPGRIEDYDPTKPSYSSSPAQRPGFQLGSKDLGYESDSTLIIRRREEHETTPPPPPLSPLQQRQVYVEVQKGGEVPLQGLRKSLPSRPSSGIMTGTGHERVRSRSPGIVPRSSILRSNSDVQPSRRNRPSAIPVRTLTPTPTNQKLKPSPELTSPRKVIQTTHHMSLRLQVERGNATSSTSSSAISSQKKPRTSTLKKTSEKSVTSGGTKKKVSKVVKIDVEEKPSRMKSPSRHQACLSPPSAKKSIAPLHVEIKPDPPAKETKKVTTNPALTPYLRETQRVSGSVFLLERNPRIPRPTFTSMLRESLRKSPRFLQLHSLYTNLERLGELEKSTCPFLRIEREFDFDSWWAGRRRRKEETEIEILSSALQEAQARKEFFFQPTSSTKIRWTREMDSGLRTRQWTIEQIKSSFENPPERPSTPSDIYKTGWRGISVRELGLNLEVASLSKSKFQFYDTTSRHGWLRRAFSMTSTLSPKERENIRKQLGELIQNSNEKAQKNDVGRRSLGGVVRGRMGYTLSSDPYRPSSATPCSTWDGTYSESAKKAISRSLSQEVQEKGRSGLLQQRKITVTESGQPRQLTRVAERCRSVSPGGMAGNSSDDKSKSNLNILTKLAAIVLRNDPGFQKALQGEYVEEGEVYYCPPKGKREIERLKYRFESSTTPRCCSQQNLSGTHPSSLDAYANWRRSRKPIYDPSSTPNVCQPTLSPYSTSPVPPPGGASTWKIDPSLHNPVSRYVPPPPSYMHYGTYPRGRRGAGVKYAESEVNIHYKAPIRLEEKEWIGEEELRRRQEASMREFYRQQREKKLLQEMEDIQSRRHMDCFTPSQKSPIPLNRYDIDSEDRKQRQKTVFARALFNFLPQNLRELRLRRGDLITVRRKLDSNWYEGELNGVTGIFPATYVQVLSSAAVNEAAKGSEGEARVKFNFRAATPVEMSINQSESVTLIRRVDQNWYEGRIGDRRGIFPASYVEILREPDQQLPPLQNPKKFHWDGFHDDLRIDTRNQSHLYRAIYNYFPSHKDELELRENDVVEVLETCDDGWCVGTSIRTGLFGTFPGNYIVQIS